jgi:hypothetical protein
VRLDVVLRHRLQPDAYSLSLILSTCAKVKDYERAKVYWRALQRAQGSRQGASHTALSRQMPLL